MSPPRDSKTVLEDYLTMHGLLLANIAHVYVGCESTLLVIPQNVIFVKSRSCDTYLHHTNDQKKPLLDHKVTENGPIAQVITIDTTFICVVSTLGTWALAPCALDRVSQSKVELVKQE